MAQFKEVTQVGGQKIIVNVDNVCTMQRFNDSTTIHFAKDHVVHVEDTPAAIFSSNAVDGRR